MGQSTSTDQSKRTTVNNTGTTSRIQSRPTTQTQISNQVPYRTVSTQGLRNSLIPGNNITDVAGTSSHGASTGITDIPRNITNAAKGSRELKYSHSSNHTRAAEINRPNIINSKRGKFSMDNEIITSQRSVSPKNATTVLNASLEIAGNYSPPVRLQNNPVLIGPRGNRGFANRSNSHGIKWNRSRDNMSKFASIANVCDRGQANPHFNRGRGRNNANPHFKANKNQHQTNIDDSNRPRDGFFGFKKLEELLHKNPEESLMILTNNKEALLNYLNGNQMRPDVIVLMFEVLSSIINSAFAEIVAQLLRSISDNNFLDPVRNYIMGLPLHDTAQKIRGRRFWNSPDQFFMNIALALDTLMEVLPVTAMDVVPHMVESIIYTLPNIEQRHGISFQDGMMATYEELQVKISMLTSKEVEKQRRREEYPDEELPPPNDFRDIDVYPTALEITTRSDTYLRKNIIKGSYKDVYHYLDVQYRLLREDFVAPLREGICEYFEQVKEGTKQRISSIKIYNNVLCLGIVPNAHQVGYLVQAFKPKTIKNLENTRRFMFGSLVCLTPDNFTTIIFGKIIDRDKKYLSEGRLVLGFDVGVEMQINRSYILVECTIYFEPYYQVLTALKQMDENRFPFKEYLVDVKVEPELPGYLHADFVPETYWTFNESQAEAYHAALTKKFCIIQGPPGTGKTYLALRVARWLLKDKARWNRAPMLVICYTNHALDQFLEGLLEETNQLVRVGGQCKNEKLENFNLRKLRLSKVPPDYFNAQRMCKAELDVCSRKLGWYGRILTMLNEFNCILKFDIFCDNAIDAQYKNSWFNQATPTQLLQWLLYQPNNKNEVKFSDYEKINEMIKDLTIQQQLEAEGQDEDEEETDGHDDGPMNAQRNKNQLDLGDDLLQIDYSQNNEDCYLLNTIRMRTEIIGATQRLRLMHNQGLQNTIEYLNLQRQIIKMKIDYDFVCEQLTMLSRQSDLTNVCLLDYANPHDMPVKDRWILYGNWLRNLKTVMMEKYTNQDMEYRKLYNKFSEVKDMLDLYKLKKVDVIGMTTTGAARLHKTLQALQCPIVIVEEAAEVLEAHIITALSPKCQHLILIGDHKQLKPSTADFKITKHYNLGVSLFERMVENGLHCYTLNVQHRMRPEIANLVCPSIYPTLINHESVHLYPPVRGVDSQLYFISHSHFERESADKSKENLFEAEYLILLARYLALNNDASRITVIVAYSGQWFVMNGLKKKYSILQKMRICILDNFQGEENDIILLSLVRNNEEGKNGFLNLENRICVALSRAKHGLYIMGNMPQLCKGSKLWREVSEVLQKYDALGEYLTVRCGNHPENVTHLRGIKDFQRVPEGGCEKLCAKPLLCGHTCAKLCHSTSHDNYKCHQPCSKVICEFEHPCPDKCYMECSPCLIPKFSQLPCGHGMDIPCHKSPDEIYCPVMVPTKLPCDHQTEKPCFEDLKTFRCPYPCDGRVEPCGHACRLDCHIRIDPNHEKYKCLRQCIKSNNKCSMPDEFRHPCQKRCCEKCDLCTVEIKKERNCGHFYDVACHANVNDIECMRRCKLKLPCGHNCYSECNKPCGPCKIKVDKQIPECGHMIKWECGAVPPKKSCNNKTCSLILQCGHKCNLPCAKDCSKAECTELVTYSQPSPCGHVLHVPCHMKNVTVITNEVLSTCQSKCDANLNCGHDCSGTCGKCAQGRFHASCNEKCNKILICGHACTMPCVENCKPCAQQCDYHCEHSKCTKLCGVPCTPCIEPCSRRCKHQTCKATCGKKCTVPPCNEPCPKFLDCLHPCVGFCGDECPPLCRICDNAELTEILFGTEDEEDARFVYLAECKHTLESSGMEYMMKMRPEQEKDQEINIVRCPKCKCPVSAPRYRDYIKEAYEDVRYIKQQYFGDPKELRDLKKALKADIKGVKAGAYRSYLNYFEDQLKVTRKNERQRQDRSKADLMSIRARLEIFQELIRLRHPEKILKDRALDLAQTQLLFLFSKLFVEDISINKQQVEEFQAEILRFNRVMQLVEILTLNPHSENMKEFVICMEDLFAFRKYNQVQDNKIKLGIDALNKAAKSGVAVTDVEKKEIVAALHLAPGHWFKCPNGHYYIITECGGANQIGKCPECGSRIGGTQHRLLDDNRFAPEMDNSRAPAFPTVNNLDMYRL